MSLNGITDDHLSKYLEVAKVDNGNHNNAKNTEKSSFLRVLKVIPNSNLIQLLYVSKVNNINPNDATIIQKTWGFEFNT